ncbi:protein of unknown function [Methylocella tundrae]|uniref:Uncharacterized protein n=1 Tax=Methylocella tundrae TaxID=227605 RepID=A0A4U8Z3Q8_METTU|nr:protein of unknown function [Methylocella tundrae]
MFASAFPFALMRQGVEDMEGPGSIGCLRQRAAARCRLAIQTKFQ